MSSTQTNGLKRPYPEGDADGTQKRSRSNNGSPAPPSNTTAAAPKIDVKDAIAQAQARARALASQRGATQNGSSSMSESTQAKIAAMKARIAAATAKSSNSVPERSAQPSYQPQHQSQHQSQQYDDGSRARGGLDVGLHPALMGDSNQDARSGKGRQAMQPKFATTMANRRPEAPLSKGKKQLDLSGPSLEEVKSNPYFDPSLSGKTVTSRGRVSKQLVFNQKGKYIQQANALRRQAALEAMKKRIAESSRKAGIDEDLDTEKAFLVPAPPDIEWWDEGLVNGSDYSDISEANLKINSPDSIITAYIQHPVALEPPQEKNMPAPKPLFLTPTEQKKLRRQRRQADLKEEQAKIRLGLMEAPPPKVKKSNLMRVLGEEAVKDPTAVEARVNREIQERFDQHMETNEARKLTKEQRHEKTAAQQESDAAQGIYANVYRIDSLANGRHRFKVNKNAEQNALTGVCIMHPKFCLVVVEGGAHSIKAYKKLMMNRIDWTENVAPNSVREGEVLASWIQALDEKGNLKDLGLNQCQLVWEGQQKRRAFRKWGVKSCETDKDARDALSRAKMESFWTMAKNMSSATA